MRKKYKFAHVFRDCNGTRLRPWDKVEFLDNTSPMSDGTPRMSYGWVVPDCDGNMRMVVGAGEGFFRDNGLLWEYDGELCGDLRVEKKSKPTVCIALHKSGLILPFFLCKSDAAWIGDEGATIFDGFFRIISLRNW